MLEGVEERWQAMATSLRLRADETVSLSANLRRAVVELSEGYRAGRPSRLPTALAAAAYVAGRMPATVAATGAAMRAAAEATPSFEPAEMLDLGAGTGAAAWAASAVWPGLHRITAIDRSESALEMARRLASGSHLAALEGAEWILGDASRTADGLGDGSADLVTGTYLLGELAERARSTLVDRLWRATRRMLLLVEPGTPDGFARIRSARAELIAAGGTVAAPCPHDAECPIVGPDWCHFAARLPRSRLHRLAKGVELPYEDEPYAYVAVFRGAVERAGRVLRRPEVGKAAIRLRVCVADGIRDLAVSRRDKDAYRQARRLGWGSRVSPDEM